MTDIRVYLLRLAAMYYHTVCRSLEYPKSKMFFTHIANYARTVALFGPGDEPSYMRWPRNAADVFFATQRTTILLRNLSLEKLDKIYSIIQCRRARDEQLSNWLCSLNLSTSKQKQLVERMRQEVRVARLPPPTTQMCNQPRSAAY